MAEEIITVGNANLFLVSKGVASLYVCGRNKTTSATQLSPLEAGGKKP